jgi:hypothetical protein
LVTGFAIPIVAIVLDGLFTWLGLTVPIELEPWSEILSLVALLSLSVSPVAIYLWFARRRVIGARSKYFLAFLALVYYVGWFVVIVALDSNGSPAFSLGDLSLMLPPLLLLMSGRLLSRRNKGIIVEELSEPQKRLRDLIFCGGLLVAGLSMPIIYVITFPSANYLDLWAFLMSISFTPLSIFAFSSTVWRFAKLKQASLVALEIAAYVGVFLIVIHLPEQWIFSYYGILVYFMPPLLCLLAGWSLGHLPARNRL